MPITKKIKTIAEYISEISSIKEKFAENGNKPTLLFRGQKVKTSLKPKLEKPLLFSTLKETEKEILGEFRRGFTHLSELKPEDEWDLIAIAQHHGLPTRLLDWTYNPLVALWFAIQKKSISDGESNAEVCILNTEDDYFLNTEDKTPFEITATKIFRPKFITRRIAAQASVFTAHYINKKNKFNAIENLGRYKYELKRITIPFEYFEKLQEELDGVGINNSTMFPDLDGFCKHLEWRFSNFNDLYLKRRSQNENI